MTPVSQASLELVIQGTRGIPANHSGFESFAERLAEYLTQRHWKVTVYCQVDGGENAGEGEWNGIRLVRIPIRDKGPYGTILFDWLSVLQARRERCSVLTLGYNTALFTSVLRFSGIMNLMNMDGIEWKRSKWSYYQKLWLWINERAGCLIADHLIADHPEIARHLAKHTPESKITMIPYGADAVFAADQRWLQELELQPAGYCLLIARPEPENSILEIVSAFARRRRGCKLVVLGRYDRSKTYHRRVLDASSAEVVFPGGIYNRAHVSALRYFSRLYIHGHTVGGTNPTLVESLGTGSPVLAHDNVFNRWVAGPGAHYFVDTDSCATELDRLLEDRAELARMTAASRARHREAFQWKDVLRAYEVLLRRKLGISTDVELEEAASSGANAAWSG
jgi:glycosyltransferase involved in cell wall biosynthesis